MTFGLVGFLTYFFVFSASVLVFSSGAQAIFITERTEDASVDVEVVGSIAYVVDETHFKTLDLAEPEAPSLLDSKAVYLPSKVKVDGNLAFVIGGSTRVRIFDVSNPSALVQLSSNLIPGLVFGVDASQGLMAVMTQSEGLRIFDISDPAMPVEVGFVANDPGFAPGFDLPALTSVTMEGSLVAVSVGFDRVRLYDVSTPSLPTLASELVSGVGTGESILSGSHLYVSLATAGGNSSNLRGGISIWDISDPTAAVEVGTVKNLRGGRRIEILGSTAFVGGKVATSDHVGFHAIDISSPITPTPLVSMPHTNHGFGYSGAGPYIYEADGSGLLIIDTRRLDSDPIEIGSTLPFVGLKVLELSGSHAFARYRISNPPAGVAGEGFKIIDISDMTNPFEVGDYSAFDFTETLEIVGSTLYYAGQTGIRAIDISTPSNPVQLGRWSQPGTNANRAELIQGLLYFRDLNAGLRVLDFSNPASAFEVALPTANPGDPLPSSGVTLTTTTNDWLNLSDPASPIRLNTLVGGGWITKKGVYAYSLVDGGPQNWRFRVHDLSTPPNDALVGDIETFASNSPVDVVENLAYVPMGIGVAVIDITSPTHPFERGSFEVPGGVSAIRVVGSNAFLTTPTGLRVFNLGQEWSPQSATPVPGMTHFGFLVAASIIALIALIALIGMRASTAIE